jgi:hypothetical protein
MKTMIKIRYAAALAITGALLNTSAVSWGKGPVQAPPAEQAEDEGQVIQLAILLDTSSSMSGLIEQTKSQLWSIVNQFVGAKQKGKVPFVQVALYQYGNSRLEGESHWVQRILPLTRDLDRVSEELFKLSTSGGSEFCGAVIERATLDLKWDPSADVYKAIFIAGNEPFTQGPIDPFSTCKAAISKGIIVNTIHCGSEAKGIAGKWKDGALMADGGFFVIDQNQAVVSIEAPQDKAIAKLNGAFNNTFITYGKLGAESKERQIAQDSNAADLSGRARSKASSNYFNARWDLVDASKAKDFKLEDVKEEDLPEELRKLKPEERRAYVDKKAAERKKISAELLALTKERETYIAAKRKELSEDAVDDTLGAAVNKAVRDQAGKKAITFDAE